MAKVKTIRFRNDENNLDYKVDINVNVDGLFTAMLPSNIADIFTEAGIVLEYSYRAKRYGCFQKKTMKELEAEITSVHKDYCSKEQIESKIIIAYKIETHCAYCTKEDEIYPSGNYVKNGKSDDWRNGTKDTGNFSAPYGISIFASAYKKATYQYKSEKKAIIYTFLHPNSCNEQQKYLQLLNSFIRISSDDHRWGNSTKPETLKQVDYTEYTAKFFYDLLISVCRLNENIKDFLEPDKITEIAEKGINLLG